MGSISRALGGKDKATETRVEIEPTLGEQVWRAPALFNRKTRRAYGILSKVWRWDTNVEGMQRTYVPRYIRRHVKALVTHKTRRERRHRATIIRIAAQKGIRL